MENYAKYEKKYIEYAEVNNKPMMRKYKKLMEQEEEKQFDKGYYEDRIKKLVKYIRIKGLYDEFQEWLTDEDATEVSNG